MIEADLDKIEAAAKAKAAWEWEPCSDDCARMDSGNGPCTCGAEKRSVAAREAVNATLSPETIIALVRQARALLASKTTITPQDPIP